MATKLTDPNDLLSEMEEPIARVRGAVDTLASLGTSSSDVTSESMNFMADAMYPEVEKLEGLWRQWADQRKAAIKKEG